MFGYRKAVSLVVMVQRFVYGAPTCDIHGIQLFNNRFGLLVANDVSIKYVVSIFLFLWNF